MELRAGYKRTEVGVIPEDWEVSSVGREFEVKLGKMLDAEGNSGVPKPYLGNRAVQWGRIDTQLMPNMLMSRADMQRFRLFPGDLLVCEGGEVGRAAIWDGQLDECYYQKALHRLRTLGVYDARLMLAYLFHWAGSGQFTNFVTQTSIAHLPREKLLQMPLPVPTRPEREAIAEALGDVDALLRSLDQLIAKKRDLKQAAMQQLLTGRQRLPGFADNGHTQTELGMIPAGWSLQALGSCLLTRPRYGINAPAVPYSDSLPAYIRITDISSTGYFAPTERASVDASSASAYFLGSGDVVFARTGASVGKSYRYRPDDGPLVFAGFLIQIRTDPARLLPDYLAHYAHTGKYWDWVRLMSMRSGQPGINGREYAQLPIALPPHAEQAAIAEVLNGMDAEIEALEARRDKTQALKQGMMQALLTGRTRLV